MIRFKNRYFLYPFVVCLALGAFLLFFFEKGDIVLAVNGWHDKGMLDTIFKYVTHLGDGLVPPIIGVLLFVFSRRIYALLVIFSFLLAGPCVTLMKRTIFSSFSRPKKFFEGVVDLNFVDGVSVASSYAFPSGHTSTAFALFAALSLIMKNKLWGVLFLCLAVVTGLSRIYLVQHFFIDTYFGAIWGVFSVCFVYFLLRKYFNKGENIFSNS